MPPVVDWGRRDYAASLDEMRELVRARRAGRLPDTLLLVEHPPVVTVGVEGDDGGAAASGLPVFSVERGGRATYHGPGQQVGYPIVDLEPRGRDVRRFVRDVESIVIGAVEPFGIRAGHVTGRPGVWVDGERKIASVGFAVEHWITFHGFALNVDPDLAAFDRFHPCGFAGSVMTSVAREVRRPISLADVRPAILRAWAERFEGSPPGVRAATESVPATAPG